MTGRRVVLAAGAVAIVAMGFLVWAVGRSLIPSETSSAQADPRAPATAPQVGHIRATLFYVAEEGDRLVPVTREVPLGNAVDQQAREILTMALQSPDAPVRSAIPAGTTLRGFYITEGGDAFVDVSAEAVTGHPGGSTAEFLTVYAIVNSVTANLPTIKRVQILVDGKEVDSLAGHVDLRRPLEPNTTLVRDEVH